MNNRLVVYSVYLCSSNKWKGLYSVLLRIIMTKIQTIGEYLSEKVEDWKSMFKVDEELPTLDLRAGAFFQSSQRPYIDCVNFRDYSEAIRKVADLN